MTDRPILFSGPMVRAILDGRKTQTRRPIKTPPTVPFSTVCRDAAGMFTGDEWGNELERLRVPHAIGDRLWVRETWSGDFRIHDLKPRDRIPSMRVWYWVDGNPCHGDWECPRPSIHMPRWASRLTLIVTDVRVQRLQEISDTDAMAEGLTPVRSPINGHVTYQVPNLLGGQTPQRAFKVLWDTINGPGAWEANPWVVATTFTAHPCNIDQMEAAE